MMHSHRVDPRALARLCLAVLLAAAMVVSGLSVPAGAASSGGRVYNPKALRPKKEPVPQGRSMRRPPPQVRDGQPLRRSYAVIPNPEPNRRGGSKYMRKGAYFYEKPPEITMSRRNWNTRSYADVIPNPTHRSRRVVSRTRLQGN